MFLKFLKFSIYFFSLSILSLGGAILIHSAFAFTAPDSDPPAGNIAALAEDDTLDNVADRGATTNQTLTVAGVTLNGAASEGNITLANQIVGYDDLFLKSKSDENAAIYYGASSHKFYTGGTEKFTINSDGSVNMHSSNLTAANEIYANAFYYSSDENLKENIKPLEDVLNKIEDIDGVEFNWKKSGGEDIGFIAQEIEKVFPELVNTDASGRKSVKYANMAAVLLQAIKEQQGVIEEMRTEINELKK